MVYVHTFCQLNQDGDLDYVYMVVLPFDPFCAVVVRAPLFGLQNETSAVTETCVALVGEMNADLSDHPYDGEMLSFMVCCSIRRYVFLLA